MASGQRPLVSVIIPVYNCKQYITACINSVFAQDYNNFEVIVADDGSTDGTGDIVDGYKEVIHLRLLHVGAAHAFNEGIRQSRGELIAWLSADDVFLSEKLGIQVEVMLDKDLRTDAVFTDYQIIDASGNIKKTVRCPQVPQPQMMYQTMVRNVINGSSVMIWKRIFEQCGYFDERLEYDVDGDMWLRLLASGVRILHIPAVLMQYRIHGGSQSSKAEIHRRWKDTVREQAIKRYSANQIFPFLSACDYGAAYRNLAYQLYGNGLTQAACAAIDRSSEYIKRVPVTT